MSSVIYQHRAKQLTILLLFVFSSSLFAAEKVTIKSSLMMVKTPQAVVVNGTTVHEAKGIKILTQKKQTVGDISAQSLKCTPPAKKGAKGKCDITLTIKKDIPLGNYTLQLVDAKKQVLAEGQIEIKEDPKVAAARKKEEALAKQKAAEEAKKKAEAEKQKALLAKKKAEEKKTAELKAKQKVENKKLADAKAKAEKEKQAVLLAKQKADAAKQSTKEQITNQKTTSKSAEKTTSALAPTKTPEKKTTIQKAAKKDTTKKTTTTKETAKAETMPQTTQCPQNKPVKGHDGQCYATAAEVPCLNGLVKQADGKCVDSKKETPKQTVDKAKQEDEKAKQAAALAKAKKEAAAQAAKEKQEALKKKQQAIAAKTNQAPVVTSIEIPKNIKPGQKFTANVAVKDDEGIRALAVIYNGKRLPKPIDAKDTKQKQYVFPVELVAPEKGEINIKTVALDSKGTKSVVKELSVKIAEQVAATKQEKKPKKSETTSNKQFSAAKKEEIAKALKDRDSKVAAAASAKEEVAAAPVSNNQPSSGKSTSDDKASSSSSAQPTKEEIAAIKEQAAAAEAKAAASQSSSNQSSSNNNSTSNNNSEPPPPAPTGTPIITSYDETASQGSNINIQWNAVDGATGYYYQIADNPDFNLKYQGTKSSPQINFSRDELKTYYFRVRAKNSGGHGPFSSTVAVQIVEPNTIQNESANAQQEQESQEQESTESTIAPMMTAELVDTQSSDEQSTTAANQVGDSLTEATNASTNNANIVSDELLQPINLTGFSINNGAGETNDRLVNLDITVENGPIKEYRICEVTGTAQTQQCDITNEAWIIGTSNFSYVLKSPASSLNSNITLYVQIKGNSLPTPVQQDVAGENISLIKNATIKYMPSHELTTTPDIKDPYHLTSFDFTLEGVRAESISALGGKILHRGSFGSNDCKFGSSAENGFQQSWQINKTGPETFEITVSDYGYRLGKESGSCHARILANALDAQGQILETIQISYEQAFNAFDLREITVVNTYQLLSKLTIEKESIFLGDQGFAICEGPSVGTSGNHQMGIVNQTSDIAITTRSSPVGRSCEFSLKGVLKPGWIAHFNFSEVKDGDNCEVSRDGIPKHAAPPGGEICIKQG